MKRTSRSPDTVDIYVGKRIKTLRTLCGMSQSDLAEPLGLNFQQIQKYENGSNRVGAGRLWRIAGILGQSPAWFFEGLSVLGRHSLPVAAVARGHMKLMADYNRCDTRARASLRELAKIIADAQESAAKPGKPR